MPEQIKWTLVLGSFTSFMVGLDALVVATALPTLHEEFGAGIEGLSWTVNAYELAFAASILTGVTLGDSFGRRRVFAVGIGVFTIASALCALSPNMEVLIASRTLQGIGGGISVPLSLALITAATPVDKRGKALGIWGAFTGVAVALGPLVGGAIVDGLAWQWIFWLNLPVGIAIVILTTQKISESDRIFAPVDLVGLMLATAGLFAIAQALIRGNAAGWSSASVIGGLIAGTGALILFVAWEHRTTSPMIPMTLFRRRAFTAGCIASFVLMAGIFALGFLTSQYLQLALHNDPLEVGMRLLPATGMALLVSPIAGRLADRLGEQPLVVLGLALEALGLLMIGSLVNDASGYGTLVGPLFVTGVGIAIAFPTVTTAVMRSAGPADAAIASGISNTFRQIGAVFGVAIAAAIFAGQGGYATPSEFVNGYRPAFVALSMICTVGAVAGIAIGKAGHHRDDHGHMAPSVPRV